MRTISLPEPNFIERDPAKFTSEMIVWYEARTGKTLQPAQIERILVDMIAYRDNLVRIGIQEAAKLNLVEYATFPMLDYLGDLVGCVRLAAQPARSIVRFTLSAIQAFNVLIPAGTRVESKDRKYIFVTEEAATIAAGQTAADVNVVEDTGETTAGAAANGYLAGEIATLVDLIAYVASASNTTTSSGGADTESDVRYRERIKLAPESFSNAGSEGAYRYWAMSAHQDIVDVAITSPSPVVVNVYPLTTTGNPDSTMIALVTAVLLTRNIRPLTDDVHVIAPTAVEFAIEADVTIYDTADSALTLAAIEAALASYAAELKTRLAVSVILTEITRIIKDNTGVYDLELTLPVANVDLDPNEWADCTDITVNIVGTHG